MASRSLAKRLVEPTWLSHPVYVETLGPEVCEVCAAAGFEPDPEQALILDLLFAFGPDGKRVAFEVDIVGPRQNFKTGVIKQAEIGWLWVTDERLIVHSAHELDTTAEAFRELADLIESTPSLARDLAPTRGERQGISEGNGRWSIELATGQRVKYKARTKGGGRGLSGDKVVLDEAFAVMPTHLGALLPTLAARPDPQVVSASSAGKLESAVLRDKRDRGRKGLSPRQLYIEYGDRQAWSGCRSEGCMHDKQAEGCALDDEARWATIQPALGRRVQAETVRSMRQSMPPLEFAREFMVWWEDPPEDGTNRAIDLSTWAERVNLKAKRPKGSVVLAIDVTPDRRRAAIGVAGRGKGGRTLVMVRTGSGTSWVVPALEKLVAKREVAEICLYPGGQAGSLIPELVEADLDYKPLKTTEAGQACAAFIQAVEHDRLEHTAQPELDTAVAGASTGFYGEAELFVRAKAGEEAEGQVDISPLIAASAAAWRFGLLKPAVTPSASYL